MNDTLTHPLKDLDLDLSNDNLWKLRQYFRSIEIKIENLIAILIWSRTNLVYKKIALTCKKGDLLKFWSHL